MSNDQQKEDHQQLWSEIPNDILFNITQKLPIYSEYIRLRAVCRRWRNTLPSTPPHPLPPQLPWLLLPPSATPHWTNGNNNNFALLATQHNHHHRSRTFYNVATNKLHTFHSLESALIYPRRIVGSSHGYLIIASETPEIFSYNPITKSRVSLPPLSTLPGVVSFGFSDVGREYKMLDMSTRRNYHLDLKQMRDEYIRKIVLSSPPPSLSSSSKKKSAPCYAFAITTSFLTQNAELAFCRVDSDRWLSVPLSDFPAEDVIYCRTQNLFYAVNNAGDVAGIRVCDDDVAIWRTASVVSGDLKYLVLLNSELFLITRSLISEADVITYCEVNKTVGFEVFRFRESGPGQVGWDPVGDFGGGGVVVFVGESSSLAMSVSEFPGCRRDRIYFTDDHSKCNDVGVFDLKGRFVDVLPCFPEDDVSLALSWESPIWITPNPC